MPVAIPAVQGIDGPRSRQGGVTSVCSAAIQKYSWNLRPTSYPGLTELNKPADINGQTQRPIYTQTHTQRKIDTFHNVSCHLYLSGRDPGKHCFVHFLLLVETPFSLQDIRQRERGCVLCCVVSVQEFFVRPSRMTHLTVGHYSRLP